MEKHLVNIPKEKADFARAAYGKMEPGLARLFNFLELAVGEAWKELDAKKLTEQDWLDLNHALAGMASTGEYKPHEVKMALAMEESTLALKPIFAISPVAWWLLCEVATTLDRKDVQGSLKLWKTL